MIIDKEIELAGYVRRDVFGRIYVDKCKTDEEHFNKVPDPGQERTGCRKYIDRLFEGVVDAKMEIGIRIYGEEIEG